MLRLGLVRWERAWARIQNPTHPVAARHPSPEGTSNYANEDPLWRGVPAGRGVSGFPFPASFQRGGILKTRPSSLPQNRPRRGGGTISPAGMLAAWRVLRGTDSPASRRASRKMKALSPVALRSPGPRWSALTSMRWFASDHATRVEVNSRNLPLTVRAAAPLSVGGGGAWLARRRRRTELTLLRPTGGRGIAGKWAGR